MAVLQARLVVAPRRVGWHWSARLSVALALTPVPPVLPEVGLVGPTVWWLLLLGAAGQNHRQGVDPQAGVPRDSPMLRVRP
jgi:hypothetical protein